MNFTDYLGNPVHVGDIIVYPYTVGSSSAALNTAVIESIDDIIPDNPSDPYCTTGRLHKDRSEKWPTPRNIVGSSYDPDAVHPGFPSRTGRYRRNDAKAYMVKVKKSDTGKSVTLKNIDRIVVVSSLVH
jgi:hypothetical protein